MALGESVLFADREIVIRLREEISALADLFVMMEEVSAGQSDRDFNDVAHDSWTLTKDFRTLRFLLSEHVRSHLDLDAISLDDLKTKEQKIREDWNAD